MSDQEVMDQLDENEVETPEHTDTIVIDALVGTQMDRITWAEAEVTRAENAYNNAKAIATAARKEFDAAVDKLRRTIRQPHQPMLPGLDVAPPASGEARQGSAPGWTNNPIKALTSRGVPQPAVNKLMIMHLETWGQLVERWAEADRSPFTAAELKAIDAAVVSLHEWVPDSKPEEDESWRFVKIDELEKHGLAPRLIEKIKAGESEPETLGEVATWLAAKPGRTWQSFPGIGEASAQLIDEAYDRFFADRKA